MKDDLTMSLVDSLQAQFKNLENVDPGSDEEKVIVNNIKVLYDILHEDHRIADAADKQTMEIKQAAKKDKAEKIEKYVKYTLEGLGIIIPPIAYARLMRVGLKFEETGTVGNPWTRGLINKVRPTK